MQASLLAYIVLGGILWLTLGTFQPLLVVVLVAAFIALALGAVVGRFAHIGDGIPQDMLLGGAVVVGSLLVTMLVACDEGSHSTRLDAKPEPAAAVRVEFDAHEYAPELEDHLGSKPKARTVKLDVASVLGRAEKGEAAAQTLAGHIHREGLGVEVDVKRASSWYHRGARQGYGPALLGVAEAFDRGQGAAQDDEQAIWFFQSAAGRGSAEAQYRLAVEHLRGERLERDVAAAFGLALDAARGGYTKAQRLLGDLYAEGRGVTRNYVEAWAWLGVAEANGDDRARELRDEFASCCMGEAEVAAATRLAVEYAALDPSADPGVAESDSP